MLITSSIFKIKIKNHVPAGETPRHLELKKMVLPGRILKRVRNLYLAVSKTQKFMAFLKNWQTFFDHFFFFDTPHFFS